jgi:ADP-glucose pyrophosphorylase
MITQQFLLLKHSLSANILYNRITNQILTDHPSQHNVAFKEAEVEAESSEYLKRMYLIQEYPQKITTLAQYYKFNRDLPRCFDEELTSVLNRYHERLKDIDFKRVKAALKR